MSRGILIVKLKVGHTARKKRQQVYRQSRRANISIDYYVINGAHEVGTPFSSEAKSQKHFVFFHSINFRQISNFQ